MLSSLSRDIKQKFKKDLVSIYSVCQYIRTEQKEDRLQAHFLKDYLWSLRRHDLSALKKRRNIKIIISKMLWQHCRGMRGHWVPPSTRKSVIL